ncbi:hypothetical protein ABW20_dc0106165 [Dactylellina cionopaga]|nr:hypothetical protein ABW20_dc0106165 [Dactylellina cionopaga]
MALCVEGCTWDFTYWSRIEQNGHVNHRLVPQFRDFNETQCAVLHLLSSLPQNQCRAVFMDNYFSSVKLFSELRRRGVGACGTVRKGNRQGYPLSLSTVTNLKREAMRSKTSNGIHS